MKVIKKLIFIVVILAFSGCASKFFSVGEEQSYCDENGCDFTDVGVCASPIDILNNKNDLSAIKKRNKQQEVRVNENKSWYE